MKRNVINQDKLLKFGRNLARIRKERGFTQEELAFQSGLSLSQIARIETGAINTTLNTVFIICDTLDIDPRELFV